MWYFAWVLGLGFAVLLAVLNAVWLEYEQDRKTNFAKERELKRALEKAQQQEDEAAYGTQSVPSDASIPATLPDEKQPEHVNQQT